LLKKLLASFPGSNSNQQSLIQLLRYLYPAYSWQHWRFERLASGFWQERIHQRELLDEVLRVLTNDTKDSSNISTNHLYNIHYIPDPNISNNQSIYRTSTNSKWTLVGNENIEDNDTIVINGNSGIDQKNNYIIDNRKIENDAEVWYRLRRASLITSYSNGKLGNCLDNFNDLDNISGKHFCLVACQKLHDEVLFRYGNVLGYAVMALYPEFNWKPWKFEELPSNFWEDRRRHRELFDWLGELLEIRRLDDWYRVKTIDVERLLTTSLKNECIFFDRFYGSSLIRALQAIYPDHSWYPWRFEKVPHGFWSNVLNVQRYMGWLREELQINQMRDWCQVNANQIIARGGGALISKNGGLRSFLERLFPFFPFERGLKRIHSVAIRRSSDATDTSTVPLERSEFLLDNLFPKEEILLNYRHQAMISSSSRYLIEFDIYLPRLGLAFEYQGQQHYQWIYVAGSPRKQQEKDRRKLEVSLSLKSDDHYR